MLGEDTKTNTFMDEMGYQPNTNPRAGCLILLIAIAGTIGLICWLC